MMQSLPPSVVEKAQQNVNSLLDDRQQMLRLTELPDAILHHIYSFNPVSMCHHQAVCQRFRELLLGLERVVIAVRGRSGLKMSSRSLTCFEGSLTLVLANCNCHEVIPHLAYVVRHAHLQDRWGGIRRVVVSGRGLHMQAVADLCRLLASCRTLRQLYLQDVMLGEQNSALLVRTLEEKEPILEELCLNSCNIGQSGMAILASPLGMLKNLQRLELQDNDIGYEGAQMLSEVLPKLCKLRTIKLARNNIGPRSVQQLQEAIKPMPCLTDLDLRRNGLDARTGCLLLHSFQDRSSMALCGIPIKTGDLPFCREENDMQSPHRLLGGHGEECCMSFSPASQIQLRKCGLGPAEAAILSGSKSILGSWVTTLDLSSNSLGPEGITVLAETLCSGKGKGLTALDLHSNRFGAAGASALAQSLRHCPNLSSLDLSWNNVRTEGGLALVFAIRTCDGLTRLNKLALSSGQSWELQGRLLEPLYETPFVCRVISRNPSLTLLDLRWSNLGVTGATALAPALMVNTCFTCLNLSCNHFNAEAIKVMAVGLSASKSLQRLSVAGNRLSTEGTKSLIPVMRSCTRLTCLNLAVNHIGPEGASALSEVISLARNLHELNISGNNLTRTGAKDIADSVGMLACLEELVLGGNQIGSAGAAALARSVTRQKMPKLNTLKLWGNDLRDEGVAYFMRALSGSITMTTLDLENNSIACIKAAAVVEGMNKIASLKNLDLRGNTISEAAQSTLLAAAPLSCSVAV